MKRYIVIGTLLALAILAVIPALGGSRAQATTPNTGIIRIGDVTGNS